MSESRRDFLRLGVTGVATVATAAAGLVAARAQTPPMDHSGHDMGQMATPAPKPAPAAPAPSRARPSSRTGQPSYIPVETPDVPRMPWTMDGDVKVFHLTCDVVKSRFVPWRETNTWGYNGSTPGPTVEAVEGERVRFVVENRLPEATVMHWHGLEVPIEMDGVEGITQDFIAPGETFVYEFTLRQNGTFFYHSHRPMQQMMGMIGLFVVHPKTAHTPRCDRDFGLILQEWATLPSNSTPNTLAMEFNWLTINGRSAPSTTPMLVRLGERVRIRFVNLGMDHHPMHIHGHTWYTTGSEGGRLPRGLWRPGNTELIGVAQARDVEFVANNPGDWMLHCHLPHHMMNTMASMVGPMSNPEHQHMGPVAANAREIPGYPQDMYMVMDDAIRKPEAHGLRPGWTGAMMGMMTLVRVLKPEMWDAIEKLKAQAAETEGQA